MYWNSYTTKQFVIKWFILNLLRFYFHNESIFSMTARVQSDVDALPPRSGVNELPSASTALTASFTSLPVKGVLSNSLTRVTSVLTYCTWHILRCPSSRATKQQRGLSLEDWQCLCLRYLAHCRVQALPNKR